MPGLQKIFACFKPNPAATLPSSYKDDHYHQKGKEDKIGTNLQNFCNKDGITINLRCNGYPSNESIQIFEKHCSIVLGMQPYALETDVKSGIKRPAVSDGLQHWIFHGKPKKHESSRMEVLQELVKQNNVVEVACQDDCYDMTHGTQFDSGSPSSRLYVMLWPEDRRRPTLEQVECAMQVYKNGDVKSSFCVEGRFDEPHAVWLQYSRTGEAVHKHQEVPQKDMTFGSSEDGLRNHILTVPGAQLFVDRKPIAVLLFWKHPAVPWSCICISKNF